MRAQHLCIAAMAALTATSAQSSVQISSSPTENMTCSSGVCSPTAKNAVLNATDLSNMLATSDVKVVTGAEAVTIVVTTPFSWTSAHRLTLDAYFSVHFEAKVTVAGQGGISLLTNDGGVGGDMTFLGAGDGSLTFSNLDSSLDINGTDYTLVRNVKELAIAVAANPTGKFALARYDNAKKQTYTTSPIAAVFGGSFEGLGHAIANVKIDGKSANTCVGLFAELSQNGSVRDLRLVNTDVKWNEYGNKVGSVAGCVDSGASLRNVWASGSMRNTVRSSVGGLVSYNSGTIDNSAAEIAIGSAKNPRAFVHAGGLVGENHGTISHSHATGAVTAGQGSSAGGLVGANFGTINFCYATGAVTADHYVFRGDGVSVGGLVGRGGDINQSFATGAVVGGHGYDDDGYAPTSAGGLTGMGSNISQSYALGSVTAGSTSTSGGLTAGGDQISQAYSTGSLVSQDDNGGFIAYPGGNVAADYWDVDTSGTSDGTADGNIPGIVGLTDPQLKSGLPAGFDQNIWAQNPEINNGYPYLIANPPPQ